MTERLTAGERADLRISDDVCDVRLTSRLPGDTLCLRPKPCPRHDGRVRT